MKTALFSLVCKRIFPLLLVGGIFFSCENDLKEVELIIDAKDMPIKTGKHIELIHSENAKAQVMVKAPLMEEYGGPASYLEMKEGVEVLFYDSAMNVRSELTADYAMHRINTKIMEVKNNVIVTNEKGEQLNTEHLIWNQDSAKIYTKQFVKITTKDEIILGEGLEANQDFSKYKIHKPKGVIHIKEEQDSIK